MFLLNDLFEAVDDDRDSHDLEAERPPALPAHLALAGADTFGPTTDVVDLDPPTPLLPYVAA